MKNRLKGITLVETLLYIGLFSIIIVIIMNFMLSAQEATRRNDINSNISRTAELITQHLSYSFDRTISVNELNSVFNNNIGVLELNFANESKQYTLIDSTLYFDSIPITPSTISVNQFLLEPTYKNGTTIIGVRITIELQSKIDSTFRQTVNLLEIVR